jgi:chemotaxis protein histidine kinase CheA
MENVLDRARQGQLRVDDEVVSLMSRGNAWIKKHFQRLDNLLEDVSAPYEVSMTTDNFAPIIYGCKAILSRSEEKIDMVENVEEGSDKDSSIRISSDYLDQFLDEVGGLINLAHIFNHSIAILESAKIDRSEIQMFKDNFSALEDRSESLQKNLMMLRRIKLDTIFKKIPKIVYKLGQVVGKQVEVECEGGDVEIDRSMLDNLEEPLVHILRNSMDHGFEENEERVALDKPASGKLRLTAEDQGSLIHLEISDDGRGINGEVIANLAMSKGLLTQEQVDAMSFQKKQELIFMAGFSTKEQTSEISGRGVGMDVVKSKILETGGSFDLKSELGQGTTIMIDLPKSATLSTRSILRVRVQNAWFGLPMDKIEYLSVMDADKKLPLVEKKVEVFPYREQMLPIISLENIFSIKKTMERKERSFIIMRMDKFKYVIEVDELDEFEIQVIQDLLAGHFDEGPFEGASVLGDGSICLMLSMEQILNLAEIRLEQGEVAKASVPGVMQSSYELTNTLVFKPSRDNLVLSIDMASVFRIDNFNPELLKVIKRKKAYNSKLGLLQYYEFSDFGIGLPHKEGEEPESVLIINISGRPLAFGVAKIVDMHSGSIEFKGKLNLPGLYQSWSYKEKLVGAVDLKYIESFFRKSLTLKKNARLTG